MRNLKKDTEVNYKSMVFVLVVGVMIGLTGCGGGGGSSTPQDNNNDGGGSSTPPSSDTQTGYLIDSAVDGVEYVTSSGKSGTTSDGGKFEYVNGDTNISFSIGGLKLPDFNLSNLNSDKKILPTDLAGVDRNNTTDGNVTKLLQILQSLDSDGDPSNGITINQATRALFVATTRIIDTNISTLTTLFGGNGIGMRSVAEARAHFESTLRGSGFGFDIDTIPPEIPTLTTNINLTDSNFTQVEINGEIGSKIFINGVDINQTIAQNGKKTILLETNATHGDSNLFTITLKDNKNNISSSLNLTINKDTINPVFTSASSILMLNSNITSYDINATDTHTITYSISSGNDQDKFSINSSTGVLSFISVPNGNNPLDSNNDNIYEVTIKAKDIAGNETTQDVTVLILNLYIESAVYDNNQTVTPNDDKLYIYFIKDIKQSSINTDMSKNYVIYGSGDIGSSSLSEYNNTLFYRHKISLNSNGTLSSEINTTIDSNISIALNQITDLNDLYPTWLKPTNIQQITPIFKTGQSTQYNIGDDGALQKGVTKNYLDNGNDTLTETVTNKMWQKTNDGNKYKYTESIEYCENLTLAGYSNWRLPTIDELTSTRDLGRGAIDNAFNPQYEDFEQHENFTSITSNYSTTYWIIDHSQDYVTTHVKGVQSQYVICIRDLD
jgi:hypothetical protein